MRETNGQSQESVSVGSVQFLANRRVPLAFRGEKATKEKNRKHPLRGRTFSSLEIRGYPKMAFWNSVLRAASTQGLIKLSWSVLPDKPLRELGLMKRRAASNKESSVCPRNPREKKLQEFGMSCLLLKKADINLLQSDVEGGFALVPEPLYEEKVAAALSENFRELRKVAPAKAKREAVRLYETARDSLSWPYPGGRAKVPASLSPSQPRPTRSCVCFGV
ncbi:hypothetical protein MRX96_048120 [Rhipicephalus microplus]